jgi:hypothetical protein
MRYISETEPAEGGVYDGKGYKDGDEKGYKDDDEKGYKNGNEKAYKDGEETTYAQSILPIREAKSKKRICR